MDEGELQEGTSCHAQAMLARDAMTTVSRPSGSSNDCSELLGILGQTKYCRHSNARRHSSKAKYLIMPQHPLAKCLRSGFQNSLSEQIKD